MAWEAPGLICFVFVCAGPTPGACSPSTTPSGANDVLQVRAVTLSGYLEVARFLGLDGFAKLTEYGIGPSGLDDPEGRLPAGAVSRLLERSAEQSGVDCFGIRMAECRSFAGIG